MFAALRDEKTDDVTTPPAPAPTYRKMPARKTAVRSKVVSARKKPNSAVKKAGTKARLSKGCSCIMCDGEPSRKSGARNSSASPALGVKSCSCIECWWKSTHTSAEGSATKSVLLRKDCSCIMCDVSPKSSSKGCSCIMCGGSAKPRRVMPKTNKKLAPKMVEKRSKNARETVPEGRFAFRDFMWTPWKLAMVPAPAGSTRVTKNWEPCPWNAGLVRTDLFQALLSKPAVYEVAVQPSRGAKKYVTYCKVSKGLQVRRSWSTHVLPRALCTTVVDQALKGNAHIYVRAAAIAPQRKTVRIHGKSFPLASPLQVKNFMVKTYDYAWQARRNQDGVLATRLLTKSGVVLSGN